MQIWIPPKIQILQVDQLVKYPRWQGSERVCIQIQRLQVDQLVKYPRWQGSERAVFPYQQLLEVDQLVKYPQWQGSGIVSIYLQRLQVDQIVKYPQWPGRDTEVAVKAQVSQIGESSKVACLQEVCDAQRYRSSVFEPNNVVESHSSDAAELGKVGDLVVSRDARSQFVEDFVGHNY